MTSSESFEDWWNKKSHLFDPGMKAILQLAFADGWYRSRKTLWEEEATKVKNQQAELK